MRTRIIETIIIAIATVTTTITVTIINLYIIAVQKIPTTITITIATTIATIIGTQIIITITAAIEIVTTRLWQWCHQKWTLKITITKIVIKIVMTNNKCRDSTKASTIIITKMQTIIIIKTNIKHNNNNIQEEWQRII